MRATTVTMAFYRRHLPHISVLGRPTFITWRLHGSLPPGRSFKNATVPTGEAFARIDRILDSAREGPLCLRRAELASIVLDAIRFNSEALGHYDLHAFVVMANHVHLLASPKVELPCMMRSLKSITARRCNDLMGRAGRFWDNESFDRVVRKGDDIGSVVRYIEWNPVRSGLVSVPTEYRWSSAYTAVRG